jgi:hypothetical protein
MSEFEHSILIDAAPQEIFSFVSDLNNLPKFMPRSGRSDSNLPTFGYYQSDGWVRVNPTEYFMEWGSDGENFYTGWLEVEELDNLSEVTVHISFLPKPHAFGPVESKIPAGDSEAIRHGLISALQSIRNILEGTGGRVDAHTLLQ